MISQSSHQLGVGEIGGLLWAQLEKSNGFSGVIVVLLRVGVLLIGCSLIYWITPCLERKVVLGVSEIDALEVCPTTPIVIVGREPSVLDCIQGRSEQGLLGHAPLYQMVVLQCPLHMSMFLIK